ncbi:hypothetical protein [Microbacterium sp.]|uniref:hypothetical protein n=1 Tax=Microbacterium sp. TaxID=51671 RepID=UPI000C070162|nr:hypothetical protein [Microbacterium sp.]PYD02313.1 hypothetical protein B4U78_001140 [Microbacterium esteraromaticum]
MGAGDGHLRGEPADRPRLGHARAQQDDRAAHGASDWRLREPAAHREDEPLGHGAVVGEQRR